MGLGKSKQVESCEENTEIKSPEDDKVVEIKYLLGDKIVKINKYPKGDKVFVKDMYGFVLEYSIIEKTCRNLGKYDAHLMVKTPDNKS